jgi:5-methylcytosine-specific restriction endonuclease McrA
MLKVPLPQVTRAIPPPAVKPKVAKPKAVKPKAAKPKAVKAKPAKAPGANKREAIPFEIRDRVWLQYHGAQTVGPCYCCGAAVEKYNAGWHCAHVLSVAKGGTETLENLRTSCGHCNLSMGDQNLYAYIRDHKLTGPGAHNVTAYFRRYPSQIQDKRTNNWGK